MNVPPEGESTSKVIASDGFAPVSFSWNVEPGVPAGGATSSVTGTAGGITRTWPSVRRSRSVRWLAVMIASTATLNRFAIELKVSPRWT